MRDEYSEMRRTARTTRRHHGTASRPDMVQAISATAAIHLIRRDILAGTVSAAGT
jgi:hypothetical protein